YPNHQEAHDAVDPAQPRQVDQEHLENRDPDDRDPDPPDRGQGAPHADDDEGGAVGAPGERAHQLLAERGLDGAGTQVPVGGYLGGDPHHREDGGADLERERYEASGWRRRTAV